MSPAHDPMGTESAGTESAGTESAGTESAGTEPSGTQPSSSDAGSGSGALTNEHGVLTEDGLGHRPSWGGSRFLGDIRAPAGYDYGGACEDSAWDVLYLTEELLATSSTFQARTGSPAPALTIAVLELGASDRERDLGALTHQLTSCVGEGPEGEVLQEAAPALAGWSGLHVVSEDRDLYWAPYAEGVVVAQLEPGWASLGEPLGGEVEAIVALQLEQLG